MKVMKKILKNALFVLLCIAVFFATFLATFLVGISIPSVKFNKPLQVDWTDARGTVLRDVSFGSKESMCYDLYIPSELNPQTEQSLILFVHGGGFTSGDKNDEEQWCKFFASKGYITATTNYSLQTEKSNANINQINEEMLACVSSIVEVCADRGYQVTEMALSGQSAGGCIAMLYAYRNTDTSPIPVRFVFQQTGPASFEPALWGVADYADGANSLSAWTGKTITAEMMADGSYLQFCNEISPAALVDENTVPTLCAYGPKDKIVPVIIKELLFEQFDENNVTYTYIEYPNSGHALMSDPDKQALFVEKALEYCDLYFLNN